MERGYNREFPYARNVLGEEAFSAAREEGRSMNAAQAIDLALDTARQVLAEGDIDGNSPGDR